MNMDDYLKEALEITRAQAGVREMSEAEIASFMRKVAMSIQQLAESGAEEADMPVATADGRKSIKEKSVICLECGKTFKIVTKRHLASHGLSVGEYKEKWGLKKDAALMCKSLQRARRKKMQDMRLWERKGGRKAK